MAPPSQLAIATSSLQRLVKEEASYRKELLQQQQTVVRLEKDLSDGAQAVEAKGEEGNREFKLRQEKKALAETEAVFPSLNERITSMKENLESLLAQEGVSLDSPGSNESNDVKAARKVLDQLKAAEMAAGGETLPA